MGEVFLARLLGSGGFEKRLVIKRILPVFSREPEFLRMFLDEARIAARLEHPNIVQIFELGEVGQVHYLAMEYVDGESLGAVLSRLRQRGEVLPLPALCRV